MDRHSLLDSDGDGDRTPTNPNVFDDEYEVEEADFVSDGFRPAQNHDREGGWRQEEGQTVAAHYATNSISTPVGGPSRSSTRKSRGQANPFASPEDGEDEAPLVRTLSGNFDVARRSVSSASSHQFARTSSPRFGAGPSHPYNMYPQGTVARTPSIATTSTIRPQRQSSTRGPQHPYALYTQGVGDDLDDDHEAVHNPVPVGFLGIGENYQRRRGPDGEEQDLLGDFGHTEQLPPYTRYPEDGPEKMPLLDVPNPPGALHSRPPVLGTDPGMELMHTQLQAVPPQQSMTDESELYRQPSIASRRSLVPSAHGSSQDSSLKTNLTLSEKWREKRRTKLFGWLPCWWLLVFVGIVVFLAGILGGALGGFAKGQAQGKASALAAAASTSLYDASIIVTATTSPPPATGTYALPLATAQATQDACLPIDSQRVAWDCDLVGDVDIQIVIESPPGSDQYGASLVIERDDDSPVLSYGSQRSQMSTPFSPFLLVQDNDAPELGPAYYFQQTYDKLVILPEDAVNPVTGKIKRGSAPLGPNFASPEDKPWFCYWNNTFVEGFIYPSKKATTRPTSTTSAYPHPATITSAPSSATTSESYSDGYSEDPYTRPETTPWSITGYAPSETASTTLTMSGTPCTYIGAASGFPGWMEHKYPGWVDVNGYPFYPPHDDDGPSKKKRGADSGFMELDGDGDVDPEQYPYQIKIEERRLPGSPSPYCVQVQVLDNWQWNWAPKNGHNDEQIMVTLTEQDPPYREYVNEGDASSSKVKLRKRKVVPGECHCQWESGQ